MTGAGSAAAMVSTGSGCATGGGATKRICTDGAGVGGGAAGAISTGSMRAIHTSNSKCTETLPAIVVANRREDLTWLSARWSDNSSGLR